MTYGIECFNAFGESVFRDGQCYYIKHKGVCFRYSNDSRCISGTLPAERVSALGSWPHYPDSIRDFTHFSIKEVANEVAFHAGSGIEVGSSPKGDRVLVTQATDKTDIVFFEIPSSGIIHSLDSWLDIPGYSPRKIACVYVNKSNPGLPSELRYFIATATAPQNLTGGVGLQVWNEHGDLTYDSRAENVRIRDFFVVSQQDVYDVVRNDDVKRYTPREPLVNPFISTTLNWSGRRSSSRYYFPKLTWDGTDFVLERHSVSHPFSSNSAPALYRAFTVTVADPEI